MRKILKSIRLNEEDINFLLDYAGTESLTKAINKAINDIRYIEEYQKELSRNKEFLQISKNIKHKIRFLKCHNDRYETHIKKLLLAVRGV